MPGIIAQTADTVPFHGAPETAGERRQARKDSPPDREAAMGWWTAGLALSALLAWTAWDAGRPGRATPPALMTMRAVGGLGLVALAALALQADAPLAALVAATGALALLIGLLGRIRPPAEARAPALRAVAARREAGERTHGGGEERRAA
jgi:hypothetical protein